MLNIYIFRVACDLTARYLTGELSQSDFLTLLDKLSNFLE